MEGGRGGGTRPRCLRGGLIAPISTRREGKYEDDDKTSSPTKRHCKISTPKFLCPLPRVKFPHTVILNKYGA